MSSPRHDDDSFSVDFSSELTSAFDFGGQFELTGDSLFPFGSYENEYDDASFSFSVESYVGVRNRQRRIRKKRRPNRQFRKKSVKQSCWYREFLRPGITRDLTHELSTSDRFGEFRNWFRMPLSKIEELTDIFINREYIKPARSLRYRAEFRERSELFIMTALYRLGTGASFRTCPALCNISISEVRLFFDTFLHAMHEMRDEIIFMPTNITELGKVSKYYEESGLPGCCGSMDVVHVKWSSCPTGDHNRAKGKGGYPSLAFQCITDFNRRILAVYGPQFGTRNDKEIVKDDPNVHFVRSGWYKDILWNYYTAEGRVEQDRGAYLICDNGYLRWPTSICPYAGCENASLEGFFSTNLESVRKDVECTFGILKKRWQVLNDGLAYQDINKCERIFNACCCLNNMMLDQMERNTVRVGRGAPIGTDGIWLDGSTVATEATDIMSSLQFAKRRLLLAKHLLVQRKKGPISYVSV